MDDKAKLTELDEMLLSASPETQRAYGRVMAKAETEANRIPPQESVILGALAGDIVGSVYEFDNIKSEKFPLFQAGSTFTDDSVMTLAVAQALIETFQWQEPISSALVNQMKELGNRYPDAGYGGRFAYWLRSHKSLPYDSWGNGSAMRVSPVGWISDSLDVVEFVAAETAKVTHNHPEGIRGAVATAGCILLARQDATNDEIRSYVEDRVGYGLNFSLDEIRPSYEFDVSCQGSVPQAIVAFLESDGFEDCIRKAVSIGGDSDTIAAIAASIAQGRYGVPVAIADEMRSRLTPDLLGINDDFCQRYIAK